MTKKQLEARNARWRAGAQAALAEAPLPGFDGVMMIMFRLGDCTQLQAEWLYRELNPLTADELQALAAYAATHKPGWKEKLRADWLEARTSGILQELRNSARFGPGGLDAFQFPKGVLS